MHKLSADMPLATPAAKSPSRRIVGTGFPAHCQIGTRSTFQSAHVSALTPGIRQSHLRAMELPYDVARARPLHSVGLAQEVLKSFMSIITQPCTTCAKPSQRLLTLQQDEPELGGPTTNTMVASGKHLLPFPPPYILSARRRSQLPTAPAAFCQVHERCSTRI